MSDRLTLKDLVAHFETQTLPATQWTHEAHLMVGLWHVYHYPFWEAHCLMKAKIMAYNQAAGTPNAANRGYHETMTLFWLLQLNRFLESAQKDQPIETLATQLLESESSSRHLHVAYYSSDVLFSVKARATWVMPDKKELLLP